MKNGSALPRRRHTDGRSLPLRKKVSSVFSRIAEYGADTKGAELLEFALALPLVLVMVVGLLDFAHAYHMKQALANAARAGARLGGSEVTSDINTTNPSSVQAIKDDVTAYLQNADIDTSFIGTGMTSAGNFTWTYYSSGDYGLEVERNVVVVDSSGISIPSTRVILRYPYDWTFGFNHIVKLLVPSASFAGPITIETDATMANP